MSPGPFALNMQISLHFSRWHWPAPAWYPNVSVLPQPAVFIGLASKNDVSPEQFLSAKVLPSTSLASQEDFHIFACRLFRTSMSQPTRPVLGYLTTSWTPPASCLSAQVYGTTPPSIAAYQGQTCVPPNGFYDAPDCWPPRTANAPAPPPYFSLNGWGFYSPGTLCPSGFTTACVATYGQAVRSWSLQFPIVSGETAAGCCPR